MIHFLALISPSGIHLWYLSKFGAAWRFQPSFCLSRQLDSTFTFSVYQSNSICLWGLHHDFSSTLACLVTTLRDASEYLWPSPITPSFWNDLTRSPPIWQPTLNSLLWSNPGLFAHPRDDFWSHLALFTVYEISVRHLRISKWHFEALLRESTCSEQAHPLETV